MNFPRTVAAAVSAITIFTCGAGALARSGTEQNACADASHRREFDEPERDAEQAAKAGNLSLLATVGFVPIVEGIDGENEILRREFRITLIEGTEHMIRDDPNSYNEIAARYAARFNRQMLHILGCDPDRPMVTCKNY